MILRQEMNGDTR